MVLRAVFIARVAVLGLTLACSSSSTSSVDGAVSLDGARLDGHAKVGADGMSVLLDAGPPRSDGSLAETRLAKDASVGLVLDAAKHDGARPLDGGADIGRNVAIDATTSDGKKTSPDGAIGDAPQPRVGTCGLPIPLSIKTGHTEVAATTVGAEHIVELPCAATSGDVVFALSIDEPSLVYADTFGAAWNTALLFTDTCPPTGSPEDTADFVNCSDDACGSEQSQATAVLGYGKHYLILSGVDGEVGDVTLHLERAAIGNGARIPLPAGEGSLTGTTAGAGTSVLCEAGGPEDSYWWLTCPDFPGGSFSASTCIGTSFDTVLALQVPRAGAVLCNDDDNACGRQSTVAADIPVGAGLQVLLVDGQVASSAGPYALAYTRP